MRRWSPYQAPPDGEVEGLAEQVRHRQMALVEVGEVVVGGHRRLLAGDARVLNLHVGLKPGGRLGLEPQARAQGQRVLAPTRGDARVRLDVRRLVLGAELPAERHFLHSDRLRLGRKAES
jgi:hypothetical protein